MSPTIRGALKHAVFLGFVSVALLSAAAFGGDGCQWNAWASGGRASERRPADLAVAFPSRD
jgi:hypothetical protein